MIALRSTSTCLFALTLLTTTAAVSTTSAAERPFGIERRTPWTTSNFRGRPEPPPPYKAVVRYPKIRFDKTTGIAVLPGTNRMFVAERGGKIFALPEDLNAEKATLFLDTQPLAARMPQEPGKELTSDSLYALEFDPNFAQNRFVYVFYVVRYKNRALPGVPNGSRVVRFKVSETEPLVCDVESETLIIDWLGGGHNGGSLKFGLDGYLYVSTGDGGVAFPPDGLKSGQDLSRLLAKVLRIDVHRQEKGRPYAIPADNPFVNTPGARGETWAYGMRNPWKMSIDRATGALWVGDVGWELWELVYNARKGDNYGWSIVEGKQPVHTEGKRGPTPIVPAAMEIPHTDGASITGGFVYRGKKLPELVGHYLFGDWETRRVWSAKVTPDGGLDDRVELIDPTVRIVEFAEDNEGEIYLLDHEDGAIYSLERNERAGQPSTFPRKLSETGLFASTARHEVAPGVVPFSVNTEQWSDFAVGERYVAVPDSGTIQIRPKPKLVPGSQFSRAVDWPLDSVSLKTLSLEMKAGDPTSRRRIETQVIHFDGREWQGYTYEWNDEQTDAVLVDRSGKNTVLHIADEKAPGGKRTQSWRFSARAECIRCHNPWSEYTLAFNLPQLNREHDYGGVRDNQIRTLRHLGLIADLFDPIDPYDPTAKPEVPKEPEALPKLTSIADASADVALRARSYLHVNCGHCHRFNGGGSSYIYLQHDLPLKETRTVGVRPVQGTFGIHEAQLITPGDPYRSVLYFRLAKTGPGHMPHLGAKIVDEQALGVVHDWIRQLPPNLDDQVKIDRLIELDEPTNVAREQADRARLEYQAAKKLAGWSKRERPNDDDLAAGKKQIADDQAAAGPKRAAERKSLTQELLSTPARAALLAEATRRDRLPPSIHQLVLETALAPSVDPAVRDLFEAFVPEEQRTKRLGDSIDAAELLKLTGDLERGRQLFHESNVVQCRNCHRIGGKGTELGPDLDSIGRKYDRAKLLESILQPSLNVDPKYAVYLVETKSGSVITGLMVRQDDKEIVLRDAQNKPQRVPADDIEGVFPQQKSLMPEMQFRDFTAAQVADLLAYLSSLKAELPK
jgi:putative heme-binding domain-containing protein